MLLKTSYVPASRLVGLGAVLLLVSAFVSIAGDKPTRLDDRVLSQSRGSNQGNALTQTSCDSNNANSSCTVFLDDCVTCAVSTYTNTIGAGANYNKAGAFSCGRNLSGTCDAAYACDTTGGNPVGTCNLPNQVMVQAH
jgi:hypothetical protein